MPDKQVCETISTWQTSSEEVELFADAVLRAIRPAWIAHEKGDDFQAFGDAYSRRRARSSSDQQTRQLRVGRQQEEPRSGELSYRPINNASSSSNDVFGPESPVDFTTSSRSPRPRRVQSQYDQLRRASPSPQRPGFGLVHAAPRHPAPNSRASESYQPTPRASPSRTQFPIPSPPTSLPNLSQLPPSPTEHRAVAFSGLDTEFAFTFVRRQGSISTSTPYFDISSTPSQSMPARPPNPFPANHRLHNAGKAAKQVTFLIVTSKNNVSRIAIERNRARRRFKSAMDLVVNRGIGLRTEDGAELVSPSMFTEAGEPPVGICGVFRG
ncbi:MAG: hypothetical protein TREMPRED_004546 [Tremellales sp. Tagirdzhanova-0007]|nr:MAG: hypothetical protein TREMPRED_004546 [Tremellales sp. Tagirdzhanova-0007]